MNDVSVSDFADAEFFRGMAPAHLETLAAAAARAEFPAGKVMFHEGDLTHCWFLILSGDVSLELTAPGRRPHLFLTLDEGDILGWSWLFPPYRWTFDVRARTDVEAICFDAAKIRAAKEADSDFGYALMQRIAGLLVERIYAARLQLMDIYGTAD